VNALPRLVWPGRAISAFRVAAGGPAFHQRV